MITRNELMDVLRRREPEAWIKADWRKVNGRIVRFVDWRKRNG